jgi:hypothetical protein
MRFAFAMIQAGLRPKVLISWASVAAKGMQATAAMIRSHHGEDIQLASRFVPNLSRDDTTDINAAP